MSMPIDNYVKVISSKETFNCIVSVLIDEEEKVTTYNKFWQVPEGTDAFDTYQCPRGIFATANRRKQCITFCTDYYPADLIIERIAQIFPDTRIEYGYDRYGDDYLVHDMFDVYENGIRILRQDEPIIFDDDESDRYYAA